MFQEFPKMLYRGESNVIARDAQHEESLSADGWHEFGDEPKPEEKAETQTPRRSRPKPEEKAE